MTPQLLAKYADAVKQLSAPDIDNPIAAATLRMGHFDAKGRSIEMVYAPFDHVNRSAKIVIVGMTPGRFQAANALRSAQSALRQGRSVDEAAAEAKTFASFSGEPMRRNLVRMLDKIGVAKLLGIASTSTLWDQHGSLVHFTSALRYPVFVDGENWSGQPDMVRTPQLRSWLEDYTGTELATLPDALIVPLGPKVAAAMCHLANQGIVKDENVLVGLPHPSGANAERIAFFLGDKAAKDCSAKTKTASLISALETLTRRVSRLGVG